MSLRLALALKLLVLAVPLVVAMAFLRADLVRRAQEEALAELARRRLEAGELERSPRPEDPRRPPLRERPGDHGRPPERLHDRPWDRPRPGREGGREGGRPAAFLYDERFEPRTPLAPPFPDALRARLEDGRERASIEVRRGPVWLLQVGLEATLEDGSRAWLLAVRPAPEPLLSPRAYLLSSVPVVLVLVAGTLVAAGPLVARVRRLTAQVRRAAREHYREGIPVEGRDELAELARAFNEAGGEIRAQVEQLEQRAASLRRFLENTSHDVALPLTVLQGHLSALAGAGREGRPADPGALRSALEETHYLAALLQNLALIARMEGEAAPLLRVPVDLSRLVERVVARERVLARERSVQVEEALPPTEPRAGADETLLEQALSNLVHNAVAHGREGGHVTVLLGEREGRFVLRVLDDGPGVGAEELERIVQRGWRGSEARERETRGSGLGLAIALDVARRHGFELTFHPVPEGGFEARLEGPLADAGS